MNKLSKMIVTFSLLSAFSTITYADVIEIATFNLKEGVSYQSFAVLDKAVEVEHVAKQPGFISRESAKGENGEWLVVVHWNSENDAKASMNRFMKAKAAAEFMSKIDTSTMSMKRYSK